MIQSPENRQRGLLSLVIQCSQCFVIRIQPRSQPAVLASACVLSTCKYLYQTYVSVRGEYRLSNDLVARRHAVACFVYEELSLRSSCARASDLSPCALYVHERNAHCLRESFLKTPIVTCSTYRARNKCVVRAWSVLTRHYLS